jgi:hypothetical protein
MPRNLQTMQIKASNARDFENLTMVQDAAHRYGRIRVLGKRAVCALTLRGALVEGEDSSTVEAPSLVPRWTAKDETDYKLGAGPENDDPVAHDLARTADRFVSVYQDFGAPDDWDHNLGDAAPDLTNLGELEPARTSTPASGVFAQRARRRTLPFVPIQSDEEGPFTGPMAWVYDETESKYVAAKARSIAGWGLKDDWGLRLEGNPNHILALNRFEDAAASEHDPLFDYDRLVATIAIETDQRLELVYETGEIAGAEWKPSDGELVIEDDTAELWYAARNTVVEVDRDGKLLTTSKEELTTIRNDVRQLYRWMAGAIARYVNARGRADLTRRGWHPYTHTVGVILTVIEEKGASHQIQAPITSVQYAVSEEGGEPQTIIRAGFAR